MVKQREALRRQPAFNANQIFFLYRRVLADQAARDTAVLRQDQQSGRVDIESSGGRQAAQAGSRKTGVSARRY